jgi:hypothetical protein
MELKDFVAETLKQILAGVKDAQAAESGDLIIAESTGIPDGNYAFSAGTYGTFTLVGFDVAVSAEKGGKGGANLKVFGVGFDGGADFKAGTANRIQFAVPVRLPDGKQGKART